MSELYVLSDANFTPLSKLKKSICEILESDVKIIQYRNKFSNFNSLNSDFTNNLNEEQKKELKILCEIVEICNDFKATLIINDNPILAKLCNAHGVHIGKDDANFKNAREILGNDKIIGVSCYNDLNLALKYEKLGANYVAFGAIFSSSTKPNAIKCSTQIVKKAKKVLNTKIAIIGGINALNLNQISDLDIDYIAIVSAAYKPHDIKQNIINLNKILRK